MSATLEYQDMTDKLQRWKQDEPSMFYLYMLIKPRYQIYYAKLHTMEFLNHLQAKSDEKYQNWLEKSDEYLNDLNPRVYREVCKSHFPDKYQECIRARPDDENYINDIVYMKETDEALFNITMLKEYQFHLHPYYAQLYPLEFLNYLEENDKELYNEWISRKDEYLYDIEDPKEYRFVCKVHFPDDYLDFIRKNDKLYAKAVSSDRPEYFDWFMKNDWKSYLDWLKGHDIDRYNKLIRKSKYTYSSSHRARVLKDSNMEPVHQYRGRTPSRQTKR